MSILFCTPMYGGNCHHAFFKSALNLHGYLVSENVPHDFYTLYNESAVHRARNQCVKAFLDTDYEFLMFIDGDIEFTVDDVGKLWNIMDNDTERTNGQIGIAAGMYRMKTDDAPYAAWVDGRLITENDLAFYQQPQINATPEAYIPVDYAGTGFMLIRREVLEKLCTSKNSYAGKDYPLHQVFKFPIREGVELSEDYAFCEDTRKLGYKVVMDTTVRLGHWGIKRY